MIDQSLRYQLTYSVIDETVSSSHTTLFEAICAFGALCAEHVRRDYRSVIRLHDNKRRIIIGEWKPEDHVCCHSGCVHS